MRKALLASTALVGAALLSAPAYAGTVGSGDNLEVKLSGFLWFQTNWLDEDVSDGHGRGYNFKIPEAEFHLNATNTADNGIKYGVSIEMEMSTEASNSGRPGNGGATNADEAWAFLSGDFGRLEMGDQDDATNRMLVGAFQAHQGLSGPFGGLGGILPAFHNSVGPPLLVRTDWQPFTSGDSTKIIYFSPRFSGFQVGISHTPDSGAAGLSSTERDDDTDFENMWGFGANYTGKFDNVGVSASILYEMADHGGISDTTLEDLEIFYIGAKVDFGGFTVGANWRDNNDSLRTTVDTAAGADGGDYWAVAVGYKQGPWGVSTWYSNGEQDNSTASTTEVKRFGIGGRYAIAPGWQIRADYNYNEFERTGSSSTDSQAFLLTNMFNF